ncbi:MAG: glycosyltransferase [Candidatus Eisenbacteria bacterium]|nr:glycosyltransferase [Candidatus Eisenbacteria bacterium]
MKVGVVVPCYRQERFLPRTVRALEVALADREWRGVLVLAAPRAAPPGGSDPLPELSPHWQVIAPADPQPGPGAAAAGAQAGATAVAGPASPRPLTPGAARMLGLAACGGAWVLFVDADVEVERAWLDAAIAAAERARDGRLAGLWGRIEEWFVSAQGERPGSPDLYRVGRAERAVDYLATLAFYRRDALLEAGGYDARLSSEEDFELGLRLRAAGGELRALGALAARHWSAPRPSFGELARRWRTGLCLGQGQVLRLYFGRPGFAVLLRRQALYLATLAMWALGVAALAATLAGAGARALAAWALLPLLVLALMALRKRSARLALHALLAWTLNGLGLLVGLFRMPRAIAPRRAAGEARC